jgi:hypothetical protein
MKVYIVHLETEDYDDYYRVFKNKPTAKQISSFKKEVYKKYYSSESEDGLLYIKNILEEEVVEN